jgi:hypothetical protein
MELESGGNQRVDSRNDLLHCEFDRWIRCSSRSTPDGVHFQNPYLRFYGAVIQAFRRVEPAWAAALTTTIFLPACNHALEFLIRWARGTPELGRSIAASMVFTIFGTLFNLYVMRKGALLVGAGTNSLWQDLREMPRLLASFVGLGPGIAERVAKAALAKSRTQNTGN